MCKGLRRRVRVRVVAPHVAVILISVVAQFRPSVVARSGGGARAGVLDVPPGAGAAAGASKAPKLPFAGAPPPDANGSEPKPLLAAAGGGAPKRSTGADTGKGGGFVSIVSDSRPKDSGSDSDSGSGSIHRFVDSSRGAPKMWTTMPTCE